MKKLSITFLSLLTISLASCTLDSLFNKTSSSSSEENHSSSSSSIADIDSSTSLEEDCDPISFHFIEQGNQYSGDCTYIKAGNYDILIDAGNRTGCAKTIETYLEDSSRGSDYVSDKKLEYVIATHAHQDYIAGFVGNSDKTETGGKNGVLYHYQVENLIDFSYFDSGSYNVSNQTASTSYFTEHSDESKKVTAIYRNYLGAREYAVSNGTNWKTAGELWASKTTEFSLGKNLKMTLLYNFFYDHTSSDVASLNSSYTKSGFSDQNDDSVCVLFTQGKKNFLFTGDSEEYAEYSLTKYNTLPEVELFKGGHHGSYTANSEALLSVIKPKMVCICCCAGNNEFASNPNHSFPAQEAINRIAVYTDCVYVTSLGKWVDNATSADSYHVPFNGNIVVSYSSKGEETLACSNNNTKLKDSDWFKANRTLPSAWANN
jgi:beta-lactamase superfamily II metal-dependent hydrolase